MNDTFGKKLYSLRETYIITFLAFFTIPKFIYAKKNKLLSEQFIERIMLAVTEVNGCGICSYSHTKMALESGMSDSEIQNMLSGISDDVPAEELAAVMFAQHYADYRGQPSEEAWDRLVEVYGPDKAKGILGAIRIIMLGNSYGIAWSSFINRFKGEADDRSNLLYEIKMVIGTIFFIPISLLHIILAKISRRPIIRFK